MSEKPKGHMYRNLLYLTQFGLNLALPPALCLWLAGWLQEKFQLGSIHAKLLEGEPGLPNEEM